MRNRWWLAPGLAAAAVVLAACGSSSPPAASGSTSPAAPASSPAASASAQAAVAGSVAIKSMTTTKGVVLVNAAGMTLYWFAKDTPTQSSCLGACKMYWPPVIGTVAAPGSSLPHGFGTIKRPNGQIQLTYDGHPLYTYAGDSASGMVTGNGLNASGGLWWAMTPAGTALGSASSSSGSGSGGGGW